jgi:hypothetical protein
VAAESSPTSHLINKGRSGTSEELHGFSWLAERKVTLVMVSPSLTLKVMVTELSSFPATHHRMPDIQLERSMRTYVQDDVFDLLSVVNSMPAKVNKLYTVPNRTRRDTEY